MDFEKIKKLNSYSAEKIQQLSYFDEPLENMTDFTMGEWMQWNEIKNEILKTNTQMENNNTQECFNHEEIMTRLKHIEDELVKLIKNQNQPQPY